MFPKSYNYTIECSETQEKEMLITIKPQQRNLDELGFYRIDAKYSLCNEPRFEFTLFSKDPKYHKKPAKQLVEIYLNNAERGEDYKDCSKWKFDDSDNSSESSDSSESDEEFSVTFISSSLDREVGLEDVRLAVADFFNAFLNTKSLFVSKKTVEELTALLIENGVNLHAEKVDAMELA